MGGGPIRVLCVEDSRLVRDAIRLRISREQGMEWVGELDCADGVLEAARRTHPDVVIFDLDMPGKSPLDAMRELADAMPEVHALVYTGHVRADLVEKAFDAGAWGYVSKDENGAALTDAIRLVAEGKVVMQPATGLAGSEGRGSTPGPWTSILNRASARTRT